jgi:streptogramin lyase
MRAWSGSIVAVLVLALPGAAVAAPVVTEFEAGFSSNNGAWDIVPGPDGNMWFTEENADRVGRITPTGVLTEFSTGLTKGSPRGITAGPDGNLWFTEYNGGGAIGRVTTAGTITEYSAALSADAKPNDIAPGPDGNLWFTEHSPARIGRIDPATQTITEYTAGLSPGSEPTAIAAGPDGNLWFTEYADPGRIGRIDPATQTITEFTPGLTPDSKPLDITTGPDGNLWFTEFDDNGAIGRITPTGVITEFGAGLTDGAGPSGIAPGPDGALWFTGSALVGRITSGGSVTEYAEGLSGNRDPWRMAAGPDEAMWFTENGNPGRIARITGLDTGGGPGDMGGGVLIPAPGVFPPAPAPDLNTSVVLRPTSGTVRVRRRGASSFVPLVSGAELPVGSEVDARRGVIALTSALPNGTTQTGSFGGGRFMIRQRAGTRGRVDLYLRGRVCSRRTSGSLAATAARRRTSRHLWGQDRGGRYRTHGRNSHATVRGTRWLVADRCGGTLTRVTRGKVVVRDTVRHKSRVLRAGMAYLARSRR